MVYILPCVSCSRPSIRPPPGRGDGRRLTCHVGRVGKPDDVADIAAFLTSHDARWVTGKVIGATGGVRL
ncbi:SDR family oxidoreductase [Streptomyces sp. NPDC056708]|uniref:SDR family oxidoreductase n=1 Tax=unclassified Streptomyces TaxID=2593676 RepID=UPI0036CADD6A